MPLFTCSHLWEKHRSLQDKVLNYWYGISSNECARVELVLGEGFCSFIAQSISANVFCSIKRLFYSMGEKKTHYQRNLFLNKNVKITFLIQPFERNPAVSLLQPFFLALPCQWKNLATASDTTCNFFSNSRQEQILASFSYSTRFWAPEENRSWTLTHWS